MAVHTQGNTTAPSAGANNTAQYNEIGPTGFLNLAQNCYITQLVGYFGATSGTMTAHLLLVGSGNSLLVDAGGQTVGGMGWQAANIAPHYMAANSNIGVAWWVSAEVHFAVYGTGKWQAESVGSPSNLNGYEPGGSYYQGGTGYYFQWIDPLSVSSVSPTAAGAGQNVTISGAGFVGGSITGITFNGVAASSWTVNSDTSLTVTVPSGASSGTLQVNSDHGSGSVAFEVYAPPTISSFSPGNGPVGTSVTITGTQFDAGVSSVKFNGVSATFTVNSATQITATVPSGATTGSIFIQNNYGSVTSGSSFTVNYPPTISNITPSPAPAGASVTIAGTYFVGATSVTFNGVSATFTVNSQTQITATVPSGAGSGNPVDVTTPYGTASYSGFVASSAYGFDGKNWQTCSSTDGYSGTAEQAVSVQCFDGTNWQVLT